MRDLLLSIWSPEHLTWVGFLLLAFGLLGEVGVFIIPTEKHSLHNALGFAFAAVVLVGYVVGHIGDDAISARFEARAIAAETELKKIKSPRTIDTADRDKLMACLEGAPKGPVTVLAKRFDGEAENVRELLLAILSKAHFELKPHEGQNIMDFGVPGTPYASARYLEAAGIRRGSATMFSNNWPRLTGYPNKMGRDLGAVVLIVSNTF